MSFSQAQLDMLNTMIASGVLRTRDADGREVQYRSMEELMRARDEVQKALASAATPRVRGVYPAFSRGC